jgi:NAD-dependent dihydropyrimidine dehydrogenase PreA subunit
MAYVIAEPCIGTKHTACLDACPVDCIHPKQNTSYDERSASLHEVTELYLIRWSASTAACACQSAGLGDFCDG